MQKDSAGSRELQEYLSAQPRPTKEALEAWWQKTQEIGAALDAAGVTEEDIIADFQELRRQNRDAKS
jgi:hypothetical protein